MAESPQLAAEQLRALADLNEIPELEPFYLAGGTGVAAHLHHRRSVDLDLFSRKFDVDLSWLGHTLTSKLGSVQVVSVTDATLRLKQGDVAIDIVRYPYPPLETPLPGPAGFPLAGLRDLSAMKLSAIAKRGARRDFWDLHQIANTTDVSLEVATAAYLEKFGVSEADLYHVLRSLTYFDDAEAESAWPDGLSPPHWRRIKAYLLQAGPALLRSHA